MYDKGGQATWQTCVRAQGDVKVLVLYYKDLHRLIMKRPEVEADVRAGELDTPADNFSGKVYTKVSTKYRVLNSRGSILISGKVSLEVGHIQGVPAQMLHETHSWTLT